MNTAVLSGVRLTALSCVFAVLVGLGSPAPLRAQEATLRKSDIVRLLSGSTYTAAEVATIIRTNCLSFSPTARDYNDFRGLGADAAVVTAIEQCAAGAVPAAGPLQVPTVDVQPVTDSVTVMAGGEVSVTIVARLGGRPAGGLGFVLRGSERVDGAVPEWRAVSGLDGRATFRVSAGTQAGSQSLTVAAVGVRLTGRRTVTLLTTAAEPSGLFVPTDPLPIDAESLDLGIGIQDAYGNPVSDLAVTIVRGSDGAEVAEGTTGSDGRFDVTVSTTLVAGERALDVRSAAGSIGTITLQPDERPATVAFVAGTSQTGLPERRLAEPVVVTVSDGAGDPVEGALVMFEISNGVADVPTSRTGADGRAVVRLTVGDDESRPVAIRATSGSVTAMLEIPVRTRAELVAEALSRGSRLRATGNTAGAIAAYQDAINTDPENLAAWVGLGETRAAAGDRDDAWFAFQQALLIDPRNAVARQGSTDTRPPRTVFELDAWGGNTYDNGRDAGIRSAEARIYPTPRVEIHLTYENALNLRHPYLTRGADDVEGFFGGVGLLWGSDSQYTTSFEFGKREEPPAVLDDIGTNQNSFTLTQDIRMDSGAEVSFGGWYGRWFDQDDWTVFAEGRFGSGSDLTMIPFVSYGDQAGSSFIGATSLARRAKEKEFRGGIRIRYESPSGWGIEPGIAVGAVTSDLDDELDGSLFDATARVWASVGKQARIQGYVRRQSPPGTPSFWTVALGLGFSVQEKVEQ